jgi:hypothetical protein
LVGVPELLHQPSRFGSDAAVHDPKRPVVACSVESRDIRVGPGQRLLQDDRRAPAGAGDLSDERRTDSAGQGERPGQPDQPPPGVDPGGAFRSVGGGLQPRSPAIVAVSDAMPVSAVLVWAVSVWAVLVWAAVSEP